MSSDLSPGLDLARRWAIELGNAVQPALGLRDAKGNSIVALNLAHGPTTLTVTQIGEMIGVNALIGVPPEIRDAVSRLPVGLQSRMLETLKLAFTECPRAGWTIQPMEATRLGQVAGIQLVEVMKLDESDVQTFNRFADAIQELSTLSIRANQVYSTLATGGEGGNQTHPPDSRAYG